jgi:hypothetical protein
VHYVLEGPCTLHSAQQGREPRKACFALACFDFEVHRRNRVCVTEQFRIQNQQELTNEFQVSTSSLILNASYTKVMTELAPFQLQHS